MAEFLPEVREALDAAIERSARLDRRIAVFDFDNTLIFNDIGELFSYYLIDEVLYRYDLDTFWDLIDVADGRDHIRALAHEVMDLDPAGRASSQVYAQYRAEMSALYGRKLERDGKRSCYAWAVRLHVGISELDMGFMSEQAILRELSRDIEQQVLQTSRGEHIEITRGVRVLEPMRALISELHGHGFEVWICSASNFWTIAQFAPRFGVPPERVIANRVKTMRQELLGDLVEPAMFMEGKEQAILRDAGMRPTLAFGDSETDLHMLRSATHLGVVIDTGGSSKLLAEAPQRGWAVQPQHLLLGDRR